MSGLILLFHEPLDELVRAEGNMGVRKLEQDDLVAVHFAQERHLVLVEQRDNVGRQPDFGRHADVQRNASLAECRPESLESLLDGAARVLVTARVDVRRHHGIQDAVVRRGLRHGEPFVQGWCTIIDARQKMTVQVDHDFDS